MNDDPQHLDLLSIFHYIVGGLAFLFSLFPLFHIFIGIAIVTDTLPEESGDGNLPLVLGWLFIVMALVIILSGIAYAICAILAGRCLKRRERYTFCLVMAAISCIVFPFGTVLGVFTILVLSRPSVKTLFTSGPRLAGS